MVGVLQRVARLDAEERLVRKRVLVAEVVDVAGGDERERRLDGKLRELRVDPLLFGEPRVLDLDVRLLTPEDLREPIEIGGGVTWTVLLQRLAHATGETAGERDDPFRVPLEQLPVDARLVVVALEVAERRELDQVAVALVRLGEQRQMSVPLRLTVPIVRDVDLATDDRLDTGSLAPAVELHGAGERAVIRERNGRHLELGSAGHEARDATGAIEDRVLRVDVKVDERSLGHDRAILRATPESTRSSVDRSRRTHQPRAVTAVVRGRALSSRNTSVAATTSASA